MPRKKNLLDKEKELYERTKRQREVEQRGGLYSDRIKIDPFRPGYEFPVNRKPIRRVSGRAKRRNGRRKA